MMLSHLCYGVIENDNINISTRSFQFPTSDPSIPDISVAEGRFWYGDKSSTTIVSMKNTVNEEVTFARLQLKSEFIQFKIFRL